MRNRRDRREWTTHHVLSLLPFAFAMACNPGPSQPRCVDLANGRCVVETFENPPVLAPDTAGVHRLTLDATEVEIDGERHCVRAYNGGFVGPTIEVAAREGSEERSVRVDLVNALHHHAFRSLDGETCTCTTSTGASCMPSHLHDSCSTPNPSEDCTCRDGSGAVCEHLFDFNVTNLHAHGSHVRPDYARGGEACAPTTIDGATVACRECGDDVCDGDTSDDACFHGDNVLNAVHPMSGARYRWDLDEDGTHHTGLQWYHPHIHGTTAMQVASGAAGALVVRGPLDALPGIADAKERIMLFATPTVGAGGFEPLADGETCSESTITFDSFETLTAVTTTSINTINGVRRPRMITAPGQVERWRILHAGFLDEVFLGLFRGTDADCTDFSTADADTIRLTQIGRDGLILPQPYEGDYVFMSPGYRIEAMLGGAGELEDGETWCLVAARFLQEGDPAFGQFGEMPMAPLTPPTPSEILARFDTNGDVVAILNVTDDAGPATETELPDYGQLATLAPDLDLGGVPAATRCAAAAAVTDAASIDQVAVLQVGYWTASDPDPCGCEAYNVNCENFELADRQRYPVDRDLPLDAIEHWRIGASIDGHPFHIHINPFIVCPDANVFDPIPFPHFRDTFLVNTGRRIDLITQNRAFTGPYVFHCHKLTHEDHGMMEVVRVCDPATDPTCGDYGWRNCDADDLECVQAVAATDCYVGTANLADMLVCLADVGGPTGVCGVNQCATDADCTSPRTCVDHVCVHACTGDGDCALTDRCQTQVCVPAPCPLPCGPGTTCQHGQCL